MPKKILSKSSYLAGLQCPKLLWIKSNAKERMPPINEATQMRFSQGYIIEEIAKSLFPEAKNTLDDDFMTGIRKTKEALNHNTTLFEPSFLVNRLYSRADVLKPTDEGWDIYEIKSSTRVKEVNLHDISFQKYVYEQAGLTINKMFVVHINNKYVYDGEKIIPEELCTITEVTTEVQNVEKGIHERIEKMLHLLDTTEPVVNIGAHCNSPYECDMKHECWAHIPEESVFDLHNAQEKCFELYAQGVMKLEEIPLEFKLSPKQLIQKATHIEQTHHLNKDELQAFFKRLTYPLLYLDFETINPGVPKYKGMRPYQRLPFQYSLHKQDKENEEPRHTSFLHTSKEDPRKKFLEQLKEDLGDEGSIIVFNRHFEEAVLRECTDAYPEFKEWFEKTIKPRVIDLMDPFRAFHFYHPKQKGSTSIKKVLPVFSDITYDNLSISSGDIANSSYERAIYTDLPEEEKTQIFKDLEAYCYQDTLAEVKIIEGLRELIT